MGGRGGGAGASPLPLAMAELRLLSTLAAPSRCGGGGGGALGARVPSSTKDALPVEAGEAPLWVKEGLRGGGLGV